MDRGARRSVAAFALAVLETDDPEAVELGHDGPVLSVDLEGLAGVEDLSNG